VTSQLRPFQISSVIEKYSKLVLLLSIIVTPWDGFSIRTVKIPAPIQREINSFWEFQYSETSTQQHEQLNGFVCSNICFYIPNTACNMSIVWLKSLKNYIT